MKAHLDPPPDRAFVGTFYFVDDFYNYLSFVQQAEDGAFLFVNKVVAREHRPALVNLEWWTLGRLSALLGRHPVLAFRLLALGAALAFVAAADLWLRRSGLAESHRAAGLLLVCLGGGLGGLQYLLGGAPRDSVDLATGLFPSIELLANPHFVTGTALLLLSLAAFERAASRAGVLGAVALGTVTGLVRPYDLVLLVAIHAGSVMAARPPGEWGRRLAPLAGLAPVVAYNGWIFYGNPAFSFYGSAPYVFPTLVQFAWALGLPLALAAAVYSSRPKGPGAHVWQAKLVVWVAIALAAIALRPARFSLQFLVGAGFPILALLVLGLARWPPAATFIATLPLATTLAAGMALVYSPNPRWYAPVSSLKAAGALRGLCRRGEVVLASPDIGLYAAGLSACRAHVSHAIATDYHERLKETHAFYFESDPHGRSALLDRHRIAHVVLPSDAGPRPATWLGEATPFRRAAEAGVLAVYSR